MCVNPPAPSILGRFFGSSALNLNFCSRITVSMNSSVFASSSPGQALFPEKERVLIYNDISLFVKMSYPSVSLFLSCT